jgi:hypothetical protein
MNETIGLLILTAFLITLREGFKFRDEVYPSKTMSFVWHLVGGFTRFFIFCVLYRLGANVFTLIVSVIIMWPLYDIACNIGLKKKWNYVGNTAWIDKAKRYLITRWIWLTK